MLDDPELIAEFVIESMEHLSDVEEHLLQMERSGSEVDPDVVNQVFRAVHSIKGAAGFLGLLRLQELSHSMESVLNLIRERTLTPTAASVELLLCSIDMLRQMLNDIEQSNEMEVGEYVKQLDALSERQESERQESERQDVAQPAEINGAEARLLNTVAGPAELVEKPDEDIDEVLQTSGVSAAQADKTILVNAKSTTDGNGEAEREKSETAESPNDAAGKADAQTPDASIRVQVEVLDQLMNLAGELVLGRNQLLQAVDSREYAMLESVTSRLDQVISELQDTIMQTRMQPIGCVFNRFMRVVRDVSKQLGKKCDLALAGQDVEVDKTISEAIGDPLNHLVRNAIDHGIELPEQRVACGKPATGRLQLRAFHQSGKVRIEISDDGKGIDAATLRNKAISKGLVTTEAASQMSDAESVRLIFHPGFSLAEKLTEVSGRGVGMDVVRSNIEKLGGSVDIKTTPGKGTTIQLTLPLTLAIIPSMVVGCGKQRFAIPQVNTAELVRIRASEMATRIERIKDAELLRLRGALLPLVRLSKTLNLPTSQELEQVGVSDVSAGSILRTTNESQAISVVVVEAGSLRYGLIVDTMFDAEEIVVKPLGRHLKGCRCLSGATILGDGRVALILDIGGIASQANLQHRQDESPTVNEMDHDNAPRELQTVLLFTNHSEERFAAPMHLVARIERISASDITEIGGEKILHYRNGALPLLSLEDHIRARPREEKERLFVIVFEASGHEVGLIASSLIDIRNVTVDFDAIVNTEPGVAGTQVIDGKTTRAIDLLEFARTARPNWFGQACNSRAHAHPNSVVRGESKHNELLPTILLAEDSSFFRRQLVGFLTSEGYRVVECEDGQIAWHTLCAGQFDVGLILTDIEMPNMNGLALARRVKADENLQHLPIIALTSLAGQEDEQRGFKAGIDEYQVKLDRGNLLRSVRRLAQTNNPNFAGGLA